MQTCCGKFDKTITGRGNNSYLICTNATGAKEGGPEGGEDGGAEQVGINCRSLTSLSLEEKSFFLPGAHFSGLPAASSQRGNFTSFVLLSTRHSMHFKLSDYFPAF